MQLSIFWRTFLMIGALIVASVLSALQLVRVFDRSPRDQQLAWEITSVINLTRVALVNTRTEQRPALLAALAREEGIRVTPLEPGDRVDRIANAFPSDEAFSDAVQFRLRHLLGADTRLAAQVNDEAGLWVSFDIDGDPYWLVLKRERFERQIGPDWLLIGLLTLALSTIGAILISRLVNRPMSRLASALERVSRGLSPEVLPERAPTEIAQVNHRFNRMASDLAATESDRAVALAGISHDVRTPLARLRMEIELSPLGEIEKESMSSEIERIDQIVGKFLDYARSGQSELERANLAEVDVSELLHSCRERHIAAFENFQIELNMPAVGTLTWFGDALDLQRMLSNVLENARRYGRSPNDEIVRLEIDARALPAERSRRSVPSTGVQLSIRDHGPGVLPQQLPKLLRPFSRADDARSYEGGSGLGLTIVDRLARRYLGKCELSNATDGGLIVIIRLPDAPRVLVNG
jgi:two-component system, OmpR family, osmolarity sensor histidine kinase EnvZ